jgi:predicted NodU family carbamoyl transferase
VLVRADLPSAVQRARSALGAPDDAEPGLAVLDGSVQAGRHAHKLEGPTLYGAAAVHAPEGASQLVGGALTADGRLFLQRVCDGDDPALADLLRALQARTGCPGVACWPLAEGQEPVVAYPADAVRVWRRTGLEALWLGPYLARTGGAG